MRVQVDTYNVYKFNELSESAKENAREWYRSVDDFSFHAEYVIEDAKECAKILGIKIDKIYYSGFSSQGDGACFVGSYSFTKDCLKNIKKHAPNDKELHDIARRMRDLAKVFNGKPGASVSHRGRYYHAYCTDISVYDVENDYHIDENHVEELKDILRDFMHWIYRRLEEEYDYQNSNEAVDESIEANEYEFLEDGKRA